MRMIPTPKSRGLFLAACLLGSISPVAAQTTNVTINNFATGTAGIAPNGTGAEWGDGLILWDNSELYPGTTGSAYIDAGFSASDGTGNPIIDYICYPGDNWYYTNPGGPAAVDLSLYSAVQFEVLWDTVNSTISIDQFNNPTTIPGAAYTSSSYQTLSFCNGGGNAGGGAGEEIGAFTIPDAASNGWATVTVPIPNNLNNTLGANGIVMEKWIANEGSTPNPAPAAFFWVANVQLIGTAAPPPPPTLQLPAKPTPGLNVFASTSGIYDRQQVGLVASNGVSWVSHATTANPVTYSFTIDGFPQNPATQFACEAYLIMAPNPAFYDLALDYNETNVVIVSLQQGPATTQMTFQYKTNEPSSETLTTVGTVTNTGTALGKWSITFTSDTNVTMTAPDGNTSSFVFTNAPYFAETRNPGCYLYLGMQANNTAGLNDAVCYSQFSLTGVPAAVTDNFLNDTTLSTNNWYNFMATGPGGVFVMPPGAEDWITWPLPDAGFQLQAARSISGPWNTLTGDKIVGGVGEVYQLITTNDIPAGAPDAFFELAKP
jgi:hypothetical protein